MGTDLLELERRRCAAFDAMDLEALRSLTTDDYMHIHGNGIFDQNREEYFKTLGTRTPGRYQTRRGELVVRDYGDFSIVAGLFHAKLWPEDGGPAREVIANASGVWRRTDQDWKLTAFQVTKKQP